MGYYPGCTYYTNKRINYTSLTFFVKWSGESYRGMMNERILWAFPVSQRAVLYAHTAQGLSTACTEACEVAGIRANLTRVV